MSRTASRIAGRIPSRIASRTALGVLLITAVAACVGEAESSNGPDSGAVPPMLEAELDPVTAAQPSAATRAAFAARRVSSPSGASPGGSVRAVPAGTLLIFEVREDVSTSSHAAGDVFALVLVDPVGGPAEAFMAGGSPARGIVTHSRPGTGSNAHALLSVHVVSVQVDGRQVHLEGTIRSSTIDTDTRAGDALLAEGSRISVRLNRDLVY